MNTSREWYRMDQQLEARTRELEAYRFIGMTTLSPMASMPDALGPDEVHCGLPPRVDGQPFGIGDTFAGRDSYLWIQKTAVLPEHRDGCEVYGLFNFGKTGGGLNSGFESLLYVDSEPYQGVDTYHADVNLEPHAGREVTLTFLLWTGLEGGGPKKTQYHRFQRADIGWLHLETDEFYYLSKAIYKTVRLLDDTAPEKHALTAALDRAYRLLDWDDSRFYDTVGAALRALKEELGRIPRRSDVTVSVVGHTHIDVAWLWRLKHTREKAQRSFASVLRLMDEFDEYVFLQSQPQLYRYLQNDRPDLYEKIRKRVQEGRWETDGGMWLEADCNISSGEALTRQFLYGIRFFQKEFGRKCEYLWLPDVFGYSWALPQILRGVGIETFVTTKISWNQYNTMPHDLFRWRGIDGSEVMAYFMTTPEIGRPLDDRFSTYNGMISPRAVLGSWAKFHDKDLSSETLLSYGYGDGGGGVNRNMLKMRRAMDGLPGLPNVKCDRAGSVLRRMRDRLDTTDRPVATWDGELYLEFHRGTYTSQARNKRRNRKGEFALAEAEFLASAAMAAGADYPQDEINAQWETLLRNQFHDIIPGSSIHEVYEDSAKEYAGLMEAADRVRAGALAALTEREEDAWTLWHFGSFSRRETVFIPETRDGWFVDPDNRTLTAQRAEDGWWVSVRLMPMALTTIRFRPEEEFDAHQPSPFFWNALDRSLETPYYEVQWDERGRIVRLFDTERSREVLPQGMTANALELYEDRPIRYENWDIESYYMFKSVVLDAEAAPELVECGPLRAVLRLRYHTEKSTIDQDVIFHARSRRIDFVTRVDWHEAHRLLKAAFPVDIRSTRATYDIQYGHVERPTHYNTSWDFARFEVVGHKWADLSEDGYGVSLLNDCKYGYNVHDNVLRITLLKSGKYPDTEADMGAHAFTYSLLPHASGPAGGDTIEEAVALNLPAHAEAGRAARRSAPMFYSSSSAVAIDAVKKAEDGDDIVLRVHECRGSHVSCDVLTGLPVECWTRCNLLEEPLAGPVYDAAIHTRLRPFEIQTFRIRLSRE